MHTGKRYFIIMKWEHFKNNLFLPVDIGWLTKLPQIIPFLDREFQTVFQFPSKSESGGLSFGSIHYQVFCIPPNTLCTLFLKERIMTRFFFPPE